MLVYTSLLIRFITIGAFEVMVGGLWTPFVTAGWTEAHKHSVWLSPIYWCTGVTPTFNRIRVHFVTQNLLHIHGDTHRLVYQVQYTER